MSRNGLVSIVMPVHNGEKYISEAIQSVIDQSYDRWQLIIVDDGSTDNTKAAVGRFDDPRVEYIYQTQSGQASALNRGLDLAKGDYYTTLDSDDWLTRSSLSARVSFLEEWGEFAAAYGDGYYCSQVGKRLSRFSDHRSENVTGGMYGVLIITSLFGTGAALLLRRDFLEAHSLRYDNEIEWCQDWDFSIRVAEMGKIGYVDVPVVNYRLHSTNMSITMPKSRTDEGIRRTMSKVLDTKRFAQTPTPIRALFFRNLISVGFRDRVEDQHGIMKCAQFRALPTVEQAKLLRRSAGDYILTDKNSEIALQWLRSSFALAPFEMKTVLVNILARVHLPLARKILRRWRNRGLADDLNSPFEKRPDLSSAIDVI